MSRLIGLIPEEDNFCYWQHLKYLLFAIALAVRGMDRGLEVISMSKQTKMLMAQYYWFSFPTGWQHYGL